VPSLPATAHQPLKPRSRKPRELPAISEIACGSSAAHPNSNFPPGIGDFERFQNKPGRAAS
jgi:hypothetical protein